MWGPAYKNLLMITVTVNKEVRKWKILDQFAHFPSIL